MVRAEDCNLIKLNSPDVGKLEERALKRVLYSGNFTQGNETLRFEEEFAEFVGVKHAIAVTSATSGLQLALWSFGIGPGDEVIIPDFSWPATGNSVIAVGAKPVFCDIDLSTYNMEARDLDKLVTKSTKAILPVHAFGQMANMKTIGEFADKHGLIVLEDAACAFGSYMDGLHAGKYGHAGVFSLHPRKVITSGEGGVVVTNSDEIAEKCRLGRTHGVVRDSGRAHFVEFGFNYRMTEFQAALARVQLERQERILWKRQSNATELRNLLDSVEGARAPVIQDGMHHTFQSFVVLLEKSIDRDQVVSDLRKEGVETTLGTYSHLSQMSYKREFGAELLSQVPNSISAYKSTLSLPVHSQLSSKNLKTISANLSKAIGQNIPHKSNES